MNIYEDKEKLFEVYLKNFTEEGAQLQLCAQISLKNEFNALMKLDYKYMPWWFVEKCMDIGYELEKTED